MRTRLMRWGFNFIPTYRRTGARVTYIADDFREIRIKLPLNWKTRNYVGTIFGGSMYAAVDSMYMIMLIKLLGPDYIVWDKAASIRFKRPGRSTLYATFRIEDQEVQSIKAELQSQRALDREYDVDLVDSEGTVHASVEKVLYVRRKDA